MPRLLVVLLTLGACAHGEPQRKPTAPVDLQLVATRADGGYQVTLTAVPTVPVPSMILSVAGERLEVAATEAGQARTFTVTVRGEDLEVVGSARIGRRSKVTTLQLGTPKAPATQPGRLITLPDGRVVEEAR